MKLSFLRRLALGLTLLLSLSLRAEFRGNIEYGKAEGEALLLDANIPEGEGPFPVAILVHGGGWMSGDKATDITPWFAPLTEAKLAWFSINYRLAPKHRWPACFDDVKTAIRWVKAHAKEFKGDPERIAIFGYSAGGQLALLAAATADDSTRVQAAVGYAAVSDHLQDLPTRGGLSTSLQALHNRPKEISPESLALLRETSPIAQVGPKMCETLLVQGELDKTVPMQQSLNFQARLRSCGVNCDMIVVPGGTHRIGQWEKLEGSHPKRVTEWLLAALNRATVKARLEAARKEAKRRGSFASTENTTPMPRPGLGAERTWSPDLSASSVLWYDKPARAWTEALPVGNGRLGAMVFSGLAEDRLQLNEDSLWTGGPRAYHHEGAAAYLPELRRLLREGKQKEAEKLASEVFMSVPLWQESYQPMADLLIQQEGLEQATRFVRSLDLDGALVRSSFQVAGVTHSRDTFSSHPDQVLVHRLLADKPGQITLKLRLASPHPGTNLRVLSPNTLELFGRVSETGLRFSTQLRLEVRGGKCILNERGAEITGADSVLLVLSGATSFVNPQNIGADPSARASALLEKSRGLDFDVLQARHQTDYRSLYRRVSIDLGKTEPARARLATDERLAFAEKLGDPELLSLYFQYGRYLLISSSRSGDQAANLQGIWNDRIFPPWGSKYTTNINLEMNYWPVEVANLSECVDPLFSMIDELVPSGRETARAHYGARGWVLHHNTDLWRGTAPINASDHGIWPTGGAWLCEALWEHYQFQGDRDFLAKRAYPAMKEAALFFVDTLIEDAASGQLVTGPTNSPEQGGLVIGAAMDRQIVRSLFDHTARAAEILGVDAEFAAQLRQLHARIAPDRIGKHGQLQEWMEDKDDPKNTHRHVSHLWALFPGTEITPARPELFKAARQSLEFRGDDGTGWSLGWKVSFWARLLEGDRALKLLQRQLKFVPSVTEDVSSSGGGTYPNLFDAHPPFQIDGNFAATAGICELLVQSQNGEIVLLPALPGAWPQGSIKGIRARGGFELDLCWSEGRLKAVRVRSLLGKPLKLRCGSKVFEAQGTRGSTWFLGSALTPEKS